MIEGKRDRLGKREIGVDVRRRRPNRVGLGVDGDQNKKKWPPSLDRTLVVREVERDGLRERNR